MSSALRSRIGLFEYVRSVTRHRLAAEDPHAIGAGCSADLIEHLLRLRLVVAGLNAGVMESRARVQEAGHDRRGAEQQRVDQLLLVDREIDRLPHFLAVEREALVVELHHGARVARTHRDLERCLAERRELLRGQLARHGLDLAGAQRLQRGVRVLDDREDDLLDRQRAQEVPHCSPATGTRCRAWPR